MIPHLSATQALLPAFTFFILADSLLMPKIGFRQNYEFRDSIRSILLGLMSVVSGYIVGSYFESFFKSIHNLSIIDMHISYWAIVFCIILDDLCFYWYHRFSHRVRWFWASHVVHHSSEFYNFTTAARQPWLFFLAPSLIFRVPLIIVGFDPALVLFIGSVNMSYQFFIHTERVNKLPAAIEFLFNTPSHHRVHHATNDRYIDRNFGGMLILWDRMFGTFQAEVREDRPRYGIVGGVESSNVLWLSWHEWFAIMRDFKLAPAGAKLKSVFGPPAAAKVAMADVNSSIP